MAMGFFYCFQAALVAYAAFTDEFFQAFDNLGLSHWEGIEMDVAWSTEPVPPWVWSFRHVSGS